METNTKQVLLVILAVLKTEKSIKKENRSCSVGKENWGAGKGKHKRAFRNSPEIPVNQKSRCGSALDPYAKENVFQKKAREKNGAAN